MTEVGVIPEEWSVVTLGDGLSRSPNYGINAPAVPYLDRLPTYIRITDISEDGRFQPSTRVSVNALNADQYFLEDGDIVFARTGASVGKSYHYRSVDGPLVFAGFLIRVHPDGKNLYAPFVAAYVTTGHYWRWVQLMSMRSGQPGINGNEYATLPIPKPPLPEQRAIAEALSDVDGLLAGLDRLIAKKRDLKQAAMQALLAEPAAPMDNGEWKMDNEDGGNSHFSTLHSPLPHADSAHSPLSIIHSPFNPVRLPGFKGEWAMTRLGELGRFLKGSGVTKDQTRSGSLACVRYGELYTHHNDVVRDCHSWISPEVASTAVLLQKGDILFAGSGETKEEIGKCAAFVSENEAYAGGDIVILRPHDSDSLFLGYYLNTGSIAQQKASRGQGDAVVHISSTALADILCFLPTLPEQTAIAEVLSDMDAEIAALEKRRAKTAALKQGMMQELLTGRVRLVNG